MKKKEKSLSIFFVVPAEAESEMEFFTLVQTKKQALEYINRRVQCENASHYLSWCELRELSPEQPDSWVKYCQQVLSREDFLKYRIIKADLPYSKLMAITRTYFGCVPLGCSFDDILEAETLEQLLDPEEVPGALKEIFGVEPKAPETPETENESELR